MPQAAQRVPTALASPALSGRSPWSTVIAASLAPHALYKLALSLGELGQTNEACLTLTEVDSRYPGSEVAGDVAAKRQALACQ